MPRKMFKVCDKVQIEYCFVLALKLCVFPISSMKVDGEWDGVSIV